MKNWRTVIGGGEFKVMRLQDAPAGVEILDNPHRIVEYLERMLTTSVVFRPDVENLMVVLLNTRKNVIGFEIIGNGTLDTCLMHPREIFKAAIVTNAASIVLAHNHPSGDPTPSEADIKYTRDVIRCGQLMKIEVLDHVILGRQTIERTKGWSSLWELGYLYN